MSDLFFLTDTIDAVEMNTSFEPLPAGNYAVGIVGTEVRQTKAGTGQFLKLTLEVTEGRHAGRKLFENLNIDNPNQQAQEIAQKTLKTLKELCGIDRLSDSSQFLGKVVPVQVTVSPRKDTGELENRLRFNPPKQGGENPVARPMAPAATAAQAQAGAATAAATERPWARKSA